MMRDVMIGLQLSALIPILVILYYRPALNYFFRLLLASILLSLFSDVLGTYGLLVYKNNMPVYFAYGFINVVLITYMWQKIPFYQRKAQNFILAAGTIVFGSMILTAFYFNFSRDAFYINSSLNVILALILALHFYYQKLDLSSYTSPLNDPYFFAATGSILFSLSTIIILAAQVQFKDQPLMGYLWIFRQIFYVIYNIILGYAFYVLHKSQVLRQ